MRQSSAEALVTEEPYALIAHVRVCGGAGWVTTGSTRKLLSQYIERHLGADALRPTWQRHRQRTRTASQEQQSGRGRGIHDRDGATVARCLATFGATLQRTGRHYTAVFADLDRASGRLERAGGAISASAAAIEDPWEWLKYQFYARHERDQGYEYEGGMER
jgi:hypothetical protein